jgi:hypothetical protein
MEGNGLRFLRHRAIACKLFATRTSAAVFSGDSSAQVDTSNVRDGGQPCDNIRKFFFKVGTIMVGTKSRGKLTNLFHQPHESSGNASFRILFVVHRMDQFLEISQRYVWLTQDKFQETSRAKRRDAGEPTASRKALSDICGDRKGKSNRKIRLQPKKYRLRDPKWPQNSSCSENDHLYTSATLNPQEGGLDRVSSKTAWERMVCRCSSVGRAADL